MDRLSFGSFLGLVTLLAVAPPATATPLPDPPFSGGGFIAPSTDVLRQEEKVVKLLQTITRKRAICDWTAVVPLQLAYTPANPTKIEEVQAKWTECVQRSDQYYAASRDRLLAKGLPSCLDAAAIDSLRASGDAVLAALSSVIYCDDDGAAPDPVTGLNIPDKKQETIGETGTAKILVKAWHYTGKCYSYAAKLAFRRNEYGETLSTRDLEKIQGCFDKVTLYAQDKIADLEQQQKLPDCLTAAAAEGAVTNAMAYVGSTTAQLYCAE
jgi:hypothetical protein